MYYYYIDKDGKKHFLTEEEKRELIRKREMQEKDIKAINKLTRDLILMMLLPHLWLNKKTAEKEKQKLLEELFIINTVSKIKEQLLLHKDTEIILTGKELRYANKIKERLKSEGITLNHPLDRLQENKNKTKENAWDRKLKKDLDNSLVAGLGREFKK